MPAPRWFADRLVALRAAAGRPTLQAIERAASELAEPAGPSHPTKASISEWLTGRSLPSGFGSLALVITALSERAKARGTEPAPPDLYKISAWKTLYEAARRFQTESVAAPVYQGLAPFERDDAHRFFGRDDAVEALLGLLDSTLGGPSGIIAVVAPSGAGKSSLLRAGLLPALEQRGLESFPGSDRWPAVVIAPGQDPMAALEHAVPPLADHRPVPDRDGTPGTDDEAVRAAVRDHAAGAAGRPRSGEAGPEARLVLVVDQFEEIFTLAEEPVRRAFIGILHTLARDDTSPAPALIVLGMRADFSQRCFDHPALVDALQYRQRLLPAMTIPQLTQAIERPPADAGVKVEPGLVQLLLQDAGLLEEDGTATGRSDPGVLPLLSHALRISWDRRKGQRGPLTAQAYLDAGRLHGAVQQTADQAWNALLPAEQDAGMWVLLNLVHIGVDPSHDTRTPRLWRELADRAAHRADAERAKDILVRERLLTVDTDTIQITHEALMRSWPLLAAAIDEHRDGLAWRQRVEEAATTWERSRGRRWWNRLADGRDPDLLWRSSNLSGALEWATRATHLDRPTPLASQFLRRSSARRTITKAGVAAVIGLLATSLILVVSKTVEVNRALDSAIYTEVVAEADRLSTTDTSLAAQLYLTAYRMHPTPRLYTSLLETQNEPLSQPLPTPQAGIVRAVAVNGTTLASASDDGTVQLWTIGARPVLNARITGSGNVTGVALSRDGTVLVSAQDSAPDSTDATIALWNITDLAHPVALGAPVAAGIGHIWGVAVSPDGKTLAGAGGDGTTRLWNIGDPSHPAPLGPALPGTGRVLYGTGITFSPDGQTLAVGGADGTVRLWNLTGPGSPVPLAPLAGGSRVTYAVAYSPARKIMVSGGGDTVMRVWDMADPSHAVLLSQPVTTPGSSILSMAVSPDGNTAAAATADNTVTLWNIADPAHPVPLGAPLTGHTRGVGAVAFSPDGTSLITGSADSTVRLWALPGTRLVGAQGNVTSLAFSHNGRTLAVAGADNAVRLWDTSDPAGPVAAGPALPHDGFVNAVAFNRDDTVLAGGGSGNSVRLWNVSDPGRPSQIGSDLAFPSEVGGVAISPDGLTLAVGCGDGSIHLFSLTDRVHPQPVGPVLMSSAGRLVAAVVFSPDGKVLATGGADHQIWLWDTVDLAHTHAVGPPLARHTDQIFQLAFSPDGNTLGSVGADHTARLWSVADPAHAAEIGPPLQRQANAIGGVAYSPDGRILVTGSDDKTLVLWDVGDPAHVTPIGHPITGHTNFVYTVAFSPDSSVAASGGRDHSVLLWQLDVDRVIQRICRTSAADLDPEAWNTYVSRERTYRPPCGG